MSEELKKEDLVMKEENKDDFKESLIQRKNLTNEFTIAGIETGLKGLEEKLVEIDAMIKVAIASKGNVERNHPKALAKLNLDERKINWVWQDQENIIAEMTPTKEQYEEAIATHKESLEVIYDNFGFVKTDIYGK